MNAVCRSWPKDALADQGWSGRPTSAASRDPEAKGIDPVFGIVRSDDSLVDYFRNCDGSSHTAPTGTPLCSRPFRGYLALDSRNYCGGAPPYGDRRGFLNCANDPENNGLRLKSEAGKPRTGKGRP